jgi:hypothetical protein
MARRSDTPLRPLTRKAFYDLTAYCRTYAADLARFDQHRVNLKQCHRFNGWLAELRGYDKLCPALQTLAPARPIARWQIIVLLVVVWLILWLALPGRVERGLEIAALVGGMGSIALTFFLPESLYGTTMELLDGKVLRVVDTLLDLLDKGGLDFSEAVYFQAKENLLSAHEELRLQIDLAHR